MKSTHIQRLVMSSAFAALIFVATAVFPFPLGSGGYANLGDTFIAVCAFFVGPVWGFAAAAVGSCLADIFLGYTIYAPATFLIKGLMALVYILIFKRFAKTRAKIPMALVSSVVAEAIMVIGYFAFECVIYSPVSAIPNIPGNLMQAAVGVVLSTVLISIFSHNRAVMHYSAIK